MNCDCDGGGNRYSSQIDLTGSNKLQALYPGRKKLPAGVCSIQLHDGESPWIVCPRRLLVMGREEQGARRFQVNTEYDTLRFLNYKPGTRLGIWSEVKLKYREGREDEEEHSFDYTFDYIVMPVGRVRLLDLSKEIEIPEAELRTNVERAGYTVATREGLFFIEDFPIGMPSIVEIMTSSTSGGNKTKRTTISMAFEDVLLNKTHNAPGINYRQVWARMVSQLIVKSEIGLNWGGKTIWVVQDNLIDYISSTTRLDVRKFLAKHSSDVNMLSFSYGQDYRNSNQGVIELADAKLYAGPMSPPVLPDSVHVESFQDIIRAPFCPPLSRLLGLFVKRKPTATVIMPG